MVVGRGVELHQDLSHHTHARLGALAHQRQGVERRDRLARKLRVAATRKRRRNRAGTVHELLEQFVGGAFLGLVGAAPVEHLHHEVAEQHAVHACLEQRDCEHRNIRVPGIAQRLADERDVVGGAAAAAGLGDHHGGLGQIVAAALDGLHDLPRD